jgi:hypothetical protein
MTFEAFTEIRNWVVSFWVMTLRSLIDSYHWYGEVYSHPEDKGDISPEKLVNTYKTIQRQDPKKATFHNVSNITLVTQNCT